MLIKRNTKLARVRKRIPSSRGMLRTNWLKLVLNRLEKVITLSIHSKASLNEITSSKKRNSTPNMQDKTAEVLSEKEESPITRPIINPSNARTVT